MDVKYYKERQHNYMIMKNIDDGDSIRYQRKMLQIKKLNNLLPFSVRDVDGESFGYYDITSKLTLRQLFGSRSLNMEDIQTLMNSVCDACDEIDKYLLDTDRLILNPDCIYYSFGSYKYSFLYNVSSTENEDKNLLPLLDYMLEHVNASDADATDYVYSVYEYAEKAEFDIWDAIALLSEKQEKRNLEYKEEIERGDCGDSLVEDTPVEDNVFLADSMDFLENIQTQPEALPYMRYVYPAMAILGTIGIVACSVIYFLFVLSQSEFIILLCSGFVSVIIFFAGIARMIKSKMDKKQDEYYQENLKAYVEDEMESHRYEVLPEIKMKDFTVSRMKRREKEIISEANVPENSKLPSADGMTTYFDPGMEDTDYKLYAIDRKNKQHIDLDKLPCTIGKMAGFVDFCIDHPSISRLHAKIEKESDGLYLSDLNSTNGICLNGMRLRPNEKVLIEPGDEIRIGSLNYCLRNT